MGYFIESRHSTSDSTLGSHVLSGACASGVISPTHAAILLFRAAPDELSAGAQAFVAWDCKKIVYTSRFVRVILAQGPC